MKAVIDFLPLALYLGAYIVADLYVATAVLIAAMALQVVYTRVRFGKVGKLLWVNFAAAAILGGLALSWSDPRYLVARATGDLLDHRRDAGTRVLDKRAQSGAGRPAGALRRARRGMEASSLRVRGIFCRARRGQYRARLHGE